jgi:hypothetical protein
MELYPWSFDSIHSHCHEDGIISYSILKEFGLSRTSATCSKRTGFTQTSPNKASERGAKFYPRSCYFSLKVLKIFSTCMIECNYIRWDSGTTGLVW